MKSFDDLSSTGILIFYSQFCNIVCINFFSVPDESNPSSSGLNLGNPNNKNTLKRRCIFCNQYFIRLSLHIMDKHGDHDRIRGLKFISAKERNIMLAKIRSEGILKHNESAMGDGSEDFQCRRRGKFTDGRLLPYCSECQQFLAPRHFNRHKCNSDDNKLKTSLTCLKGPKAKEFEQTILATMRSDVLGNFVKQSNLIVATGFEEYKVYSAARKSTCTKTRTHQFLRQFGRVMYETLNIVKAEDPNIELENMFRRRYMKHFEAAFENIGLTEFDGEKVSKKNFGYVFKRALKSIKVLLEMDENKSGDVQEIKNFISLFEDRWKYNFLPSEISANTRRMEHIRRPANLPTDADLSTLRNFIEEELKRLMGMDQAAMNYVHVRRIVASKLLSLNTRRPDEVASLTLENMQEALKGVWLKDGSEASRSKFYITYVKSKVGGKPVSVIFPKNIRILYDFLMNKEVRDRAGIRINNNYIFPSKDSNRQSSTYHDFKHVTTKLGISITATQLRHYSSSEYAQKSTNSSEDSIFYEHMGHSEHTNKHVYQIPRAEKTLMSVAPFLDGINGSEGDYIHCIMGFFYLYSISTETTNSWKSLT